MQVFPESLPIMTEHPRDTPSTLSDLIRDRMAERGWTYSDVARNAKAKGHVLSRPAIYSIATRKGRHHIPYDRTLRALAAALEYPFDVLSQAAAEQAGYSIKEVRTTLKSAGTLRILAAAHEELDMDEQAELARLAEKYVQEVRDKRRKQQNGC